MNWWQSTWQRCVAFVRTYLEEMDRVDLKESASALTYTTLFAIVPVMTVAFSILAALPALQEQSSALRDWAFEWFAPSVGDQVIARLHEFSRQANNLTAIGAAFLIVTSVMLLRTTERTMNRIWQIRSGRGGVTSLMMYWSLLTLGPIALGVALGASSYLTSVSLVGDVMDALGVKAVLLALLPFFVMTAMMTAAYVVIPNCHVPLREALIGGAVAALLFELAKGGFSLFIRSSPSYQVIYGAFAAVPLFLLWVYISWAIFLGGALLVYSLVVFSERRQESTRLQALLRLLHTLWRHQQAGRTLRLDDVRGALLEAGAGRWDEFRNVLIDIGLMRRTDDNCYVLAQDLAELTLADLLTRLPWPGLEVLRLQQPAGEPAAWERELARRTAVAREGFAAPLAIPLRRLFECRETDHE